MTATILVLDGFGVGAMPDAGEIRSADSRADTFGSLSLWAGARDRSALRVPHLAALGLATLRPDLGLGSAALTLPRVARRAALGYPGADTFAGHQTMMGADMSHVVLRRLEESLDEVRAALHAAGHRTALLDGGPVIVVDDELLVHDNLEADPGLIWNVSARLDYMPWESILHVASAVRSVAPVARVIAVGGYSSEPLPAAVRPGAFGVVGLDTPASGFYRNGGLRVQHFGADIDHRHQLPEVTARAGLPVTLIGKAADILATDADVVRLPGVSTERVLADAVRAAHSGGLVVANVQQTDLAGHQQDPARFIELLEQVDATIPNLLDALGPGDLLVVVADHGNDPLIGHAHHTREYVPVLAASGGRHRADCANGAMRGVDLESLADVGASVAAHLGLDPNDLAHGSPTDLLALGGATHR
ncbi:phosphopentomutase [Xylanimonas ulmi]|uniref:Phosphopentomutase n=1 Tax=Xylanimonas ulmi TaxID=228973 RepID=A0A4Q7M6X6_9MICO|nr:phosphopentomutase [Xylanibacterium ulmi]RZS62378.1 phosphopentomutase [Xylanibacterium ulmi]